MYQIKEIQISELTQVELNGKYPGNQSSWIKHWYQNFKDEENNDLGYAKKPCILVVYKDKELIAIVPLLRLTRVYFGFFKLRFLEFLGQQWSGLGYDIIQNKRLGKDFAKQLLSWIKKHVSYDFLFLKYLPANSCLFEHLHKYQYAGAPYINLANYPDYTSFSKQVYTRKFREDLRRTERRIQRDGYTLSYSLEQIDEKSLKEMRRIAQSKLNDGKSNLYANTQKESFHYQMYRDNPSQVVFVKFNDVAVAYGTSIDYRGMRIGIDAAYDRNFRRYGAGIHCIDQVIRHGFLSRMQQLSFGMGMDSYKFQFTNCIEAFFMTYQIKYSLKSLLVFPYFKYLLLKTHRMVSEQMSDHVVAVQTESIKESEKTRMPLEHSSVAKM